MSKNLITRILVAAVAIPIILWICYQGGGWLFGMVLLFALIASLEFLVQEGFRARNFLFWLGLLAVALMVSRFHVPITYPSWYLYVMGGPVLVVMLILISGMVFATGSRAPDELFKRYVRYIWGLLYIGLLYPYMYLLGSDHFSNVYVARGDWLLFLFGLLWVGDTAAMGFGKWLGRHRLAPAVSPNKTVEGFIGGLVGALAIGVLMYFWKFREIGISHVLILALGCSVFGQLGDLVESMWKRSLGIKDSSPVIPGHGGILDRFDSLLFAAPFMFLYRLLFILQ